MRTFRLVAAAVAVAAATSLTVQAGADPVENRVHGHAVDEVVSGEMCPPPALLCTAGRLTGGIQGDLEFAITSLTPAGPPGVLAFTAMSTIRTADGDISCADSGSFNTGGSGEGVHLCVITGGTGVYAGASGYLQEAFTFVGTTGTGVYTAKVVK